MAGQIRSYIMLLDESSDDAYINRIKALIDELTDEKEKQLLSVEFTNKINQISIIRKYREQFNKKDDIKPIVKEETYEEKDEDILYTPNSNIEEKLFLEEVNEEKFPIIEAPAYAILHLASTPFILVKESPSRHDEIAKKYNIPTRPIYDGKVA